MDLFDPKFVSFIWDSSLSGLKGFFAQDIGDLQKFVNENIRFVSKTSQPCFGTVEESSFETSHPFNLVWYTYQPTIRMTRMFRFFYYDPLYDIKRAWLEGDIVECRTEDSDWVFALNPCWDSNLQYRISPPDAFATNHEVAQWVSQGKGEILLDKEDSWGKKVVTYHSYCIHDAFKPALVVGIRRWGETEWHSPTRDYLNN